MKIIIPCCGRSSRFPNQPPKWILPAHDGRPMLALAIARLRYNPDDLVVTILQEHEEQFRVSQGIADALGSRPRMVVLNKPTRSQAETVACTLRELTLSEPFLIKDSDNTFELTNIAQDYNYICVDSLNNHDTINPRNKSYLQVDHRNVITNIREKVVISDLFSVGGYFFRSPQQFLEFYDRLLTNTADWQRELYISDVIGSMILEGVPFQARNVVGYEDWGTIHEWRRSLRSHRGYFILLDGFVFERGSEFFHPQFADVKPNAVAVDAVGALARDGHSIVYLSIRPSRLAELTGAQIEAAGLPAGQIVFDCPIAAWMMLTAPHPTLPFQASRALEIQPDDPNLLQKIMADG
jgi:hypothetical protein